MRITLGLYALLELQHISVHVSVRTKMFDFILLLYTVFAMEKNCSLCYVFFFFDKAFFRQEK